MQPQQNTLFEEQDVIDEMKAAKAKPSRCDTFSKYTNSVERVVVARLIASNPGIQFCKLWEVTGIEEKRLKWTLNALENHELIRGEGKFGSETEKLYPYNGGKC